MSDKEEDAQKELLLDLQRAGADFRNIRLKMGFNQKDFCHKYGLDKETYSKIERGLTELNHKYKEVNK